MSTIIVPFIYGLGEDRELGLVARMTLCLKYKVPMNCLKYIEPQDCCDVIGPGAQILQYNLIKEGHYKHKSTVCVEWRFPDELLD